MLLFGNMNGIKIFSKINVFIILIFLVIISQVILLKPIIGQGLTNEDYLGFFKVRLYKDQMFSDPVKTWNAIGLHDATHDFYIGFLNIFFGENYTMYLYASIFIKIIATLLLYTLILILTKNKLLAFLASLLYGISYSSTGALYLYVVGNEYLGVALMVLFLIIYSLCVKRGGRLLILLSSITLILSFLASPIRVFPVLIIVFLTEVWVLLKNNFSNLRISIIRGVVILLPTVLIAILNTANSGSGAYSIAGWPVFLQKINNGNWYLLLNPLWGFGYTFLPAWSLRFIGSLNILNLTTFIYSIVSGGYFYFLVISLTMSVLVSDKRIRMFFNIVIINLVFNIVNFFLYTHHFSIAKDLVFEYAGPSFNAGLYSGVLAGFILSISFACGIEWVLNGKKDRLLFVIFLSPLISLFFILSQWFFTRDYYMYQEGIHRYFVIPAIGSSLFIASLLTLLYQRIKQKLEAFSFILIVLIITWVFSISYREISQLFNGKKMSGVNLKLQQSMQQQALKIIPGERLKDDLVILIKFKSGIPASGNQWENTFDWRNLTYWMPVKKSYILDSDINGCTILIWDAKELDKWAKVQNGEKGFLYQNSGAQEMRCFRNGLDYSIDGEFIKADQLFAFAVEGLKVINVTDEIQEGLVFK